MVRIVQEPTFPSVCIDNFYENPDEIRNYALSLDFSIKQGTHDSRTQCLSIVNLDFYHKFCDKILSIFFQSPLVYKVHTAFHIHTNRVNIPDAVENMGNKHVDVGAVFAGVIYLTPNPNSEAGTKVYTSLENDPEETIVYKNVYNRLVMFDGKVPHGINTFYMPNEPRLTQVIFVNALQPGLPMPLQRLPKVKL
jgi:hypothetical protein